jgi:hypothetical protein
MNVRSRLADPVQRIIIALLGLLVCSLSATGQIRNEKFPDGVEHWYRPGPEHAPSYLMTKLRELYRVASPTGAEPFGRSIAILVGVGSYHFITPQLPSVRNDIIQMRDFLLRRAGFDEVYVAVDDTVNRDLIERYVKEVLINKASKNDRLLFYYSGHGADNHGRTGYMQFGGAKVGQFYGPQVLAINAVVDWSREIPLQHVLFILDSCASGLAFSAKSGSKDSGSLLLRALSGNGSRTVLTAGTAEESAYALEGRRNLGNSIFTKALLDSFDAEANGNHRLITISELFAGVEKEVAKFRVDQQKAMTPRMWLLQETEYRGTFVFLNPNTNARLTDEQAKALGVTPSAKAGDVVGFGIIDVYTTMQGDILIDGVPAGFAIRGQSRQYLRQPVGKHQVQLNGTNTETREVVVESGAITYATFGVRSPIDDSGATPVGTLVIDSVHEMNGLVSIDSYAVGKLEKNQQITIAHLTAGEHRFRIDGPNGEVDSGSVQIPANETTYLTTHLSPPTNLRAVEVH